MAEIHYDTIIKLKTIKYKYFDSIIIFKFKSSIKYDTAIALFFKIPTSDYLQTQSSYALPSKTDVVLSHIKNEEKILKLDRIEKKTQKDIYTDKWITYGEKVRIFYDEAIVEDTYKSYLIDLDLDIPKFLGRTANWEDYCLSIIRDLTIKTSFGEDIYGLFFDVIHCFYNDGYYIEIYTKRDTKLVYYELINADTNEVIYKEIFFRSISSYIKGFHKKYLEKFNLSRKNIRSRIYFKDCPFFFKERFLEISKPVNTLIDLVIKFYEDLLTKTLKMDYDSSFELQKEAKVIYFNPKSDVNFSIISFFDSESLHELQDDKVPFYYKFPKEDLYSLSDVFPFFNYQSIYELQEQNNPVY